MTSTAALNEAMHDKLAQIGIPCDELIVFGAIRQNVHVVCLSLDAATKWVALLGSVYKGARVQCVKHTWNASANSGTFLRPTMRTGWLVAVAG